MRNRARFLILAALPALSILPAIQTARAADSPLRATINARYSTMVGAFRTNRMDEYDRIVDPGYTSTSLGGEVMDKIAYMNMLRGERKSLVKLNRLTYVAGGIAMLGPNEVKTTATLSLDMVSRDWMGMLGPKNAVHRNVFSMRYTDTWVRANKTWLLKSSVELPGAQMSVDGKPFNMTGPAPK